MKQLLQSLKTGQTSLLEVPAPRAGSGPVGHSHHLSLAYGERRRAEPSA